MEKVKRPNVILILTDDQGYPDVACNGNPWLKTPNLDELHDRGVRMCDYHTDPMCAPTRASILSGQYSMRAGVWSTLNARYYLSQEYKLMPEYFKDSGYKTAIFGKWHMGDVYPYRACDRGFDHVVSFGGGVVGETPDYWDNDYFDDYYKKNGELKKYEGYCTDVWFNETIEFIEENKDQPFFVYLPTNAPHDPYHVADEYSKPYRDMGLGERISNFYGMITNIDDNIGKLNAKLQELGIEEDTIILFMGDNGSSGTITDAAGNVTEGYNGTMRGKKGQVYEGSHKNSLFIKWLGGDFGAPRDVTGLTGVMDLLPTLIDCCHLNTNGENFDGISMYDQLASGASKVNDGRHMIIHRMQEDFPEKYKDFTVLTDDVRFIKTSINGNEQMMYFDMKDDFSQEHNLITEHLDEVNTYMGMYEAWWDDVTDFEDYPCEAISIGNDDSESFITCHAWHANKNMAYSQNHIRKGVEGSGYYNLYVEETGMYKFELARWPKESGLALHDSAALEVGTSEIFEKPQGRVFDICAAQIVVGEERRLCKVTGEEQVAEFILPLEKGLTRMQTWFLCNNGECIGAYYIYVQKL